jgi:hypothetical protein
MNSVSNQTSKRSGGGLPLISLMYSTTTSVSQVIVVLMIGYRSLKNFTSRTEVGGGPRIGDRCGRATARRHSFQPLSNQTSKASAAVSHTSMTRVRLRPYSTNPPQSSHNSDCFAKLPTIAVVAQFRLVSKPPHRKPRWSRSHPRHRGFLLVVPRRMPHCMHPPLRAGRRGRRSRRDRRRRR